MVKFYMSSKFSLIVTREYDFVSHLLQFPVEENGGGGRRRVRRPEQIVVVQRGREVARKSGGGRAGGCAPHRRRQIGGGRRAVPRTVARRQRGGQRRRPLVRLRVRGQRRRRVVAPVAGRALERLLRVVRLHVDLQVITKIDFSLVKYGIWYTDNGSALLRVFELYFKQQVMMK